VKEVFSRCVGMPHRRISQIKEVRGDKGIDQRHLLRREAPCKADDPLIPLLLGSRHSVQSEGNGAEAQCSREAQRLSGMRIRHTLQRRVSAEEDVKDVVTTTKLERDIVLKSGGPLARI